MDLHELITCSLWSDAAQLQIDFLQLLPPFFFVLSEYYTKWIIKDCSDYA